MAAFQRIEAELEGDDIRVLAASTDPLDKAQGTVEKLGLKYPLGYVLPLKETAATLGAFYEEKRAILHATGFVLRPSNQIAVSQYSSGPIGRLVPEDAHNLIKFLKSQG